MSVAPSVVRKSQLPELIYQFNPIARMPIDTRCMEKVDLFLAARDLPKIPILR
jgi:hypothetical protein